MNQLHFLHTSLQPALSLMEKQELWHKSSAVLITVFLAFHGPLAHENLLTLASSCSISTDMVSNILSWVELFSSGVVSDLEEEKRRTIKKC